MRTVYVLLLTATVLFSGMKIDAPLLGWVFDREAMAIRPIPGTLGAAILGAPLDVGFPIASAVIAAQGGFAVVVSAEDHRVRVISLKGALKGAPAARTIDGTDLSPGRMILSPSGASAMLYSGTAARMQVITGLPDAPVVSAEIDTRSFAGVVTEMAVSDEGDRRLFVIGGRLWSDESAGVSPVPLRGPALVVAFRRGSRDAIALTEAGELHRIGGDGSVSAYGVIKEDSGSAVAGIQLSGDGTHAYVAYSNGNIVAFNSASGSIKTASCNCKASGLHALNSTIFRVNEMTESSSPLMVVDVSGADPRVWFVPRDRSQR